MSQAPNTVSILTFITYVVNLDGVKLHWVGGKHLFFSEYGLDMSTSILVHDK